MPTITGTLAAGASWTLATYRAKILIELQDTGSTIWANDDIDQALRNAIDEYQAAAPHELITTLTFAAASREISVASIAPLSIRRVWLPYTAADPEDPPEWRTGFELWPGNILRINDGDEPAAADVARVWYTKPHTINGLDSATTTTIPDDDASLTCMGAAAYAAAQRARELISTQNAEEDGRRMNAWSITRMNDFRARLNRIRKAAGGAYVTWKPARRNRVPRE
jgi:hypothetical protein